MSLRRLAPLVLLLGLWACKPTVPYEPPPTFVDYAVFDLTASPPSIPQPNDLAINPLLAATVPGAQGELLRQFIANGGFPYDQEVPVTVDFTRATIDAATGNVTPSAPDLDLGSIVVCTSPATPCNLLVMRIDGIQPGPAPFDAAATSYVAGATKGTLTLRNNLDPVTGSRRWPAGARYLVAFRGGADGIQTAAGGPFWPQVAFSLLLQGKDLSDPENASLLPPGFGGQLEQLRQNYLPVFAAVDNFFPKEELAVLTTFQIASAGTWVEADSGIPVVPLPSDFLMDPSTGRVQNLPAAFGPLAPGIATLDGFSTTAMILAQTSGPILGASVRDLANLAQPPAVFLYKLGGAAPVEIHDLGDTLVGLAANPPVSVAPGFVAEPPPIIGAGGLSEAIGLQPATPASVPGVGDFFLPPLEEATEYAVLVTDRVKDQAGNPIRPTTLGKILLFTNSICTPSPACVSGTGTSNLAGVSPAEAGGLEGMRLLLAPAVAKLQSDHGLTKAQVAMAYTFRTQSITGKGAISNANAPKGALQLAVLPYAGALPDAPAAATAMASLGAAESKYGLPAGLLDTSAIDRVVEATIVTYNLLDPTTGAFLQNPDLGAALFISALVVIPRNPMAPAPPLVVFRHGITRGRADVLAIANALAGQGMVVAAIDADKHGDRSFCKAIHLIDVVTGQPVSASQCATNGCVNAPDVECATNSTCVPDPAFAGQGDTKPAGAGVPAVLPDAWPGRCTLPNGSPGSLAYKPVATSTGWNGTGGVAVGSSEYFVTSNLFRLRDSVRQDVIDQSVLVRALTSTNGQLALQPAAPGYVVDPTKVYYVGTSQGGIQGPANVSANPRFGPTVLNAAGGTYADIAATSQAFAPLVDSLLASLGIVRGSPEFLQFVNVAKWVLDPADPINFASHLVKDPLPDLLANPNGSVLQPPKAVLGQAGLCDPGVPNATSQLLYATIGLSPASLPTDLASTTPASFQWYLGNNITPVACPVDATTHPFLLDGANVSITTKAQTAVATFLLGGGATLSSPVTP